LVLEELKCVLESLEFEGNRFADDLQLVDFMVAVKTQAVAHVQTLPQHAVA
jgi:hypothetical protein